MAATPAMDEPSAEILTASLQDVHTVLLLRNRLKPLLPYSLPLLRRCQFYLHERSNQTRRVDLSRQTKPDVWIATSRSKQKECSKSNDWLKDWLQGTSAQSDQQSSTNSQDDDQSYWIAAYIDITEPGQTQVWLFSSWEPSTIKSLESSSSSSSNNTTPTISSQALPIQYELFQHFYRHLRKNHIPLASQTPSKQWLNLKESGKVLSTPYIRSKVLFGTLSEAIWWMHEDWVVKGHGIPHEKLNAAENQQPTVVARQDRPYLKYILTLPPSDQTPTTSSSSLSTAPPFLPPNMHFFNLKDTHLQTMLDRSIIPRTLELLRTLITTGLFTNNSPDPIAWGILGKDASVSSLHTEPAYRGQGLAELVARELCRRMGEVFYDDEIQENGSDGTKDVGEVLYVHTDVSTENIASQRVFEKMGAKVGWKVGWVEVDVGEEEEE